MTFSLRAIKELEYRAKRLHNRFSFKTESTMKKPVNSRNALDFESDVEFMLPAANELNFITIKDNYAYAQNIFNTVQRLLIGGNKIVLSGGTNEEMNELVMKETQKILDLILMIKDNDRQFKNIIFDEKHRFGEQWFIEIAKHIQITNDVSVFVNELNGGDIALHIKKALLNPNDKEIKLYGIDRDIDCGADSRKKGIETARNGLAEVSSLWADISFCSNHYINFGDERNYYIESEIYNFYRKKLTRQQGIFIFNYPFYRIDDVKNILRNNELIAAINTNDEIGNIVFVLRYGTSKEHSKKEIQKIEYQPHRLPSHMTDVINYYTKHIEEVKTFRGKYTDMHDIRAEFEDQEDSAEFLFDYYQPRNKLQQLDNPLIEYKPDHVPAIATSEIINGRYVDEILQKKTGKEFGFDHLFSTKIVKRETEEKEEKVDKDGNKVVEISEKKSNVIVSIALIAQTGEYVELFSNETEDDNNLN
ncbi:hypothetical protein P4679_27580 [Priestia megaterium]|uniref:hypothetical protein n=1 Tax=Priestia megaterium TaxID=1404 RepID=UPI002E1CD7CE|nr:hypothetical protein [Priestia megaterium]